MLRADAESIGSFCCGYSVFAFVSYVMEDILLCNSGVWAEGGGIEVTVKVGIYRTLHPYVDRECFKVSKAKQGRAGGYLVSDSFDFFELLDGVFIA